MIQNNIVGGVDIAQKRKEIEAAQYRLLQRAKDREEMVISS